MLIALVSISKQENGISDGLSGLDLSIVLFYIQLLIKLFIKSPFNYPFSVLLHKTCLGHFVSGMNLKL